MKLATKENVQKKQTIEFQSGIKNTSFRVLMSILKIGCPEEKNNNLGVYFFEVNAIEIG